MVQESEHKDALIERIRREHPDKRIRRLIEEGLELPDETSGLPVHR